MTYQELIEHQRKSPPHKRQGNEEFRIQCACFSWFNLQYPKYRGLLYHVANGELRNKVVAGKLKAAGVVPGVADLILDIARGGYHGLKVEIKTANGKQSPVQRDWQHLVEEQGFRYVVCHSFDEFREAIDDYLLL